MPRARPRRNALHVINRGSDSESESDNERRLASRRRPSNYEPPPISPYSPTSPDTTPLPLPHNPPASHPYYSPNPMATSASVSGSSTRSSPAPDTTPPPSTPGQSQPPTQLTVAGDNDTVNAAVDRDSYPKRQVPHYGQLFDRSYSAAYSQSILERPSHEPQRSASSPQTYAEPEREVSPKSHTPHRSLEGRIVIMATTDGDYLAKVDISGAKEAPFIREQIFSKLRVADEDQLGSAIYRTTLGEFPIGEPLSDEELFRVCHEFGDAQGTLKFLVQNSHFRPADGPFLPPAPENSPAFALSATLPRPDQPDSRPPLQRQRQRQRSLANKDDGQSSASERIVGPEGYDASLSDNDTSGPIPRSHVRFQSQPESQPRSPPRRTMSPPQSGLSPQVGQQRQGSVTPTPPPQNSLLPYVDQSQGRPIESEVRERIRRAGRETQRVQEQREDVPIREPGWVDVQRQQVPQFGERPVQFPPQPPIYPVIPGSRPKQETWNPPSGGRLPATTSAVRPLPPTIPGQSSRPGPSQYPPSFSSRPQGGRPLASYPIRLPVGPPAPLMRQDIRGGQAVPSNWPVTWNPPHRPTPPPLVQEPGGLPPPRLATTRIVTKSMDHLPNPGAPSPTYRSPLPPGPNVLRDNRGSPSRAPQLETNYTYRSVEAIPPSPHNQLHPDPSRIYNYPPPSPTGFTPRSPGFPMSAYPSSPRGQGEFTPLSLIPGRSPGVYPQAHNEFYVTGVGPVPVQRTVVDDQGNHSANSVRRMPSPPPGTRHRQYSNDPPRSPRPYSDFDARPHHQTTLANGSHYQSLPQPSHPNHIDAFNQQAPQERPMLPSEPTRQTSGGTVKNWSDDGYDGVDRSQASQAYQDSKSSAPGQTYTGGIETDEPVNDESESTLRPGERERYSKHFRSDSAEATIVPSSHPGTDDNNRPGEDESSGSDEDYWNGINGGPPPALPPNPKLGRRTSKPVRGPPLTLKIDPTSPITVQPPSSQDVVAPPNSPLKDKLTSGTPVQRRSSFIKRNDQTWAFRPPAEDVYDRLGEFFPDHDLDKPVIELVPSGGSSPTTAAGAGQAPVPAPSGGLRKSHKKSIRHVAFERKRHMDRDSKLALNTSNVLRRHSTKLWGSRVEEVTAAEERGSLISSVPESPPAVNANTKPIFKWVKGDLIGKGSYGRVYLAMNITTGEMMAVKQVDRPQTVSDQDDQRQVSVVEALKSESETLKDLDHPHIVQYLGFEESTQYVSIFLEYVPGGSVAGCLRRHGKFEEDVVKSFTSQMLDGLEYLHNSGILHRDMKADNVLVDHMGICKISDFGISKRGEDIYNVIGVMTQMKGSFFWMAPEVMHNEGYNAKIDIWSLGCIVMEMWAGRRPWNQEDVLAVIYKLGHLKEQPPVPPDVVLTPVAEDFRMKCLAINPVDRPTASQLRSHPYLALDPKWTFTGFR